MLKNRVYLIQGDTTVGFLSQNREKLYQKKKRDRDKAFLQVVNDFKTLKKFVRVPNKFKKLVRGANKTTFVYLNNMAIRVVKDSNHKEFLKSISWAYSTSANESGKNFELNFAIDGCDIIVYEADGFSEKEPSKIFKLSKLKKERLR